MEEEVDKIDFRFHERDEKYTKQASRMYRYLANYHDHQIVGEEKIPDKGPCLFVVNHSFATYDIGILQYKIYKKTGIFPRGFADNAFFKIPLIGKIVGKSGAVPGRHHVGEYILKEKKDMALVAPGGMREALKPKEEKYHIKWDTRKGFIKLALKTNTPIVLAACPAADDLYKVYDNKLTKVIYKNLRLPFPLIKGRGRTLMPRKVQLKHYIGGPYLPPEIDLNDEALLTKTVDEWHAFIVNEMVTLMNCEKVA